MPRVWQAEASGPRTVGVTIQRFVAKFDQPQGRLEALQTLRYSNVDLAFSTSFMTLTTGVFMVGLIQFLGGSDLWIGVMTAVPSLAGILQIPGAIWGRGFSSYKRFVFPGGLIWRCLYIPLIALPLLALPNELRLTLFMLCVALGSASVVLVNPVFNDWLAELVPAESRGYYFSRRNAIATATAAVVGIAGAILLDLFRNRGQQGVGFSAIFLLSVVCAFISLAMFMRMADTPREHPIRQSLWQGIKAVGQPFGDREFRRVLTFLAVFGAGQVLAGNLFSAFALESLKLDFKVVQGTAVSYALGNVLAARVWGFLSDKYGNKPVLLLVGLAMALNPLPWVACIPGRPIFDSILLLSAHVAMGAVFGGVALCQFNLMLATAKPDDRANYIGAGMTITTLVAGLAPLAGAELMHELRFHLSVEHAYKGVFLATSALRVVGALFLLPVREKGASAISATIRDLRGVTPRGVAALRSLARSKDAVGRANAIESVGEQRVNLAADEIIKALHDPQPRVRRQAASALARLNDPRAVGELIHQIEFHPDLIEDETVEALGELQSSEAVPVLVGLLQSPRSLVRRSAARALGDIGSPNAVQPLIAVASDPSDPYLRRAALQARRVIGAPEAESAISNALVDPLPSVRIAAAEAAQALGLSTSAPSLRRSLQTFADEACSEVAYTLGAVGDESDIPAILREAQRSVSIITRRRCLLGVARQLGVEQRAYRLLLLEGMSRDTALLEILRPALRRNRKLQVAVARFSSGDEPGALVALALAWKDPRASLLAQNPVPELFLIACAAMLEGQAR